MAGRDRTGAGGIELWNTEWAVARAAEALRYLGSYYPECVEVLQVLDEHETAAHKVALLGDREGYWRTSEGT